MKDRQNNSQPVAQAVHQKQPVSPAKLTVAPLDNTPLSNWNLATMTITMSMKPEAVVCTVLRLAVPVTCLYGHTCESSCIFGSCCALLHVACRDLSCFCQLSG